MNQTTLNGASIGSGATGVVAHTYSAAPDQRTMLVSGEDRAMKVTQ